MIGKASREVQIIATRADNGQTITQGWFRLSFNYNNITQFDPQVKSQTDLIPFNATADQVRMALEGLDNCGVVEVRRYGPFAQNTFAWKVTLDWSIPVGTGAEDYTQPIGVTGTGYGIGSPGATQPSGFGYIGSSLRGDLPMLVASQVELFDVTWLGGYDVVWVREYREGSLGPELCEELCKHEVTSLKPGSQYQFRVRARNGEGWSEWSGSSDVIRTHTQQVPSTPDAPALLSATSNSIALSLVRGARGFVGLRMPSCSLFGVVLRGCCTADSRAP